MKKKYNKKKEKPIIMDEFRQYKKERHPKYVGLRVKKDFLFLSLTHKPPRGKEKEYIRLKYNPDSCDESKAYISTKVERDTRDNFGARKKNMRLSDSDKKTVQRFFAKNRKGKN
mgnify:CR=1 FL=1